MHDAGMGSGVMKWRKDFKNWSEIWNIERYLSKDAIAVRKDAWWLLLIVVVKECDKVVDADALYNRGMTGR